MKKIKKYILIAVLLLVAILPVFSGCDIEIFAPKGNLTSPLITLSTDNNCLTWNTVPNATSYNIYCGSKLIDSISDNKNTLLYDLTPVLQDTGSYEFYVVATSDSLYKGNSDASNSVTYNYKKSSIQVANLNNEEFDTTNKIKMTLNQKTLNFLSLSTLPADTDYLLYLYSATSGLNVYPVTGNTIDLGRNSYLSKDEIYAIRMGYVLNDKNVIASDTIYYNPDNFGEYTDNIYMFDGYINDFYVENLQELRNLVYYSFIYRMTDYDIKISGKFKDFCITAFGGSTMLEVMNNAIAFAYLSELDFDGDEVCETIGGGFYETMALSANNSYGFVSQLSNSTEYNIKVDYYGVKECDTTITPSYSQVFAQGPTTTYYDTCGYEMLGDTYDDFVSDKQFLYTTVATSEELYWAVENKITPVFANTTCRAYKVYNKAKNVLRQIISNEMTDYEKALSIFDWIATNTHYDYTQYSIFNGYSYSVAQNPMYLACYYLEGVFDTGYAVCDGFSKAFSLMCNMVDIDALRVMGTANTGDGEGGHAWNKVLLDIESQDEIPAQYYLVDITWTEIVSNGETEELSHKYFCLSDEDVKDTHFELGNRKNKFNKYLAFSHVNYYLDTTFKYNDQDNDLVISNKQELNDMFAYLLDSSNDSMEVVVDYDFMVDELEKVYGEGSYLTATLREDDAYYENGYKMTSYNYSTDTMYYYSYIGKDVYTTVYNNYKLMTNFQSVMKASKFAEQYLFLHNEIDRGTLVYDEYGNKGILYIFTQNLLIDDMTTTNEVEHLVNYLSDNQIFGTYRLYIDTPIIMSISQGQGTYLDAVQNLFADALSNANVNISFTYLGTDDSPSNNTPVYEMTVTAKA